MRWVLLGVFFIAFLAVPHVVRRLIPPMVRAVGREAASERWPVLANLHRLAFAGGYYGELVVLTATWPVWLPLHLLALRRLLRGQA